MFHFHLKQSSIPVITLICVLGWTPDAQAYFDPGTGSMGSTTIDGKCARISLYPENLFGKA